MANTKIRSPYMMKGVMENKHKLLLRHDDEEEKEVLFDRKLSFRQHIGS